MKNTSRRGIAEIDVNATVEKIWCIYTKSSKMKLRLLVCFLAPAFFSYGQSHSFYSQPDTICIESKIFGSLRKITVSVPNDAGKLKQPKHCILYLDGDDDEITGTLLQAANNLYLYDDIPQSILVGVFHEKRDQELVEKTRLYDFINSEVMPLLKEKYLLENRATIVGHSFGAYFATFCFLRNNALFNNCIAISPAFWPNGKDIYAIAKEALGKPGTLSGNFYMAAGDKRWDDISLRDGVLQFKALFENNKNTVHVQFDNLTGFNHNSSPTVGFGLGLNFCFDRWEWGSVAEEQDKRIKSFPGF